MLKFIGLDPLSRTSLGMAPTKYKKLIEDSPLAAESHYNIFDTKFQHKVMREYYALRDMELHEMGTKLMEASADDVRARAFFNTDKLSMTILEDNPRMDIIPSAAEYQEKSSGYDPRSCKSPLQKPYREEDLRGQRQAIKRSGWHGVQPHDSDGN